MKSKIENADNDSFGKCQISKPEKYDEKTDGGYNRRSQLSFDLELTCAYQAKAEHTVNAASLATRWFGRFSAE